MTLQVTQTNKVAPKGMPPIGGTYLLESRWRWDHSNYEFATICLEPTDYEGRFEDILDSAIPGEEKNKLLEILKRIYEAQVPGHGSRNMVRLYRVEATQYEGYSPGFGFNGRLLKEAVELKLQLKPLFDFDDAGNPVSCKIDP